MNIATKPEYLDGVNVSRLRDCLTFLGCASDGMETMAASLPEFINRLTMAVERSRAMLAAPAGMRAAFEAWAPSVHMRTERWNVNPELYDDESAISAWQGWEAGVAWMRGQVPAPVPPGYKLLEDGKTMIPEDWTPLRLEWEPGYPEDVACGPARAMERLKKWLDAYFVMIQQRMTTKTQAPEGADEPSALDIAREALDEIALAGMSGTGQESEEGMRDWHARQAWKFIGIAARAIDKLKVRAALAAQPQAALAYQQANPLGGPAKVFRAMADAIEAGDSYEATLRRYGYAEAKTAPAEGARLSADDVQWIVNDIAELGVMIHGQAFFLYKGHSLVYEEARHDDGRGPMHYRPVFKREFGECAYPINYADPERIGTVSLDDSEDWRELPAAAAQPQPKGATPAFNGWYCAHCQRGVDGSEVTYHEQHTVCGRVITDDVPPPSQAPAPAPDDKALTQALEERDAASDYIDALLDEVLGADRHEWTSAYGHADAMAEVRERMSSLLQPMVDKAWSRFEAASQAPAVGARHLCSDGVRCLDACQLNEPCRRDAPAPATEQARPVGPIDVSFADSWTEAQKIGFIEHCLRWPACGYVNSPERIESIRLAWKMASELEKRAQRPAQQPLTDEQRRPIITNCHSIGEAIDSVEFAHGIGSKS